MGISGGKKKKKELTWSALMVVLQSSFLATKIFSMMEGSLNVLNLLNAPVTSPSAGILREAPKGPSLKTSNTGLSLLVLAA